MRAVLFANGLFNHPDEVRKAIRPDDLIIAADGGAQHCLSIDILPAVVIGDLDSLQQNFLDDLARHGTRVVDYPRDKDKTDLELAMQYALEAGVKEILLLGLLGGRLDQSLANLLLLTRKEWQPASLAVLDPPDYAQLMRSKDHKLIHGSPGDIVSLIPLTRQVTGVYTQGLRWQLTGATLHFGTTWSLSNELMQREALVQIDDGELLLVQRKVS